MAISSFLFLLFFIILFSLYYFLKKWQWIILLLSSYVFYASWKPAYIVLIFLITLVTYIFGLLIERYDERKKIFLFICLFINIGILAIFKYLDFFGSSFSSILHIIGIEIQIPQFKLLLPIGISFYTFQIISYLVDVYRKKIKAEKHFGYFALFVSFFPQILAGPIERAGNMLPQYKKTHSFEYGKIVDGLKLFTLGFFKKIVVADNLGLIVDNVFSNLHFYKGFSLIFTIILFSWQIYADFSGYTDMVRGIARILGIELMPNFRTPYLSQSIGEFWRRWHISLSSWFKDYVYIPLGGNRRGLLRGCLNTVIVFTLCGLWHGAGYPFLLWGLFHGLMITAERLFTHITKGKILIPSIFSIGYTYVIVCVSWVLFRSPTIEDALYVYQFAFSGFKNFLSLEYVSASLSQIFKTNQLEMGITFFCLLSIISIELISNKTNLSTIVKRQPIVIRWILYTIIVSISLLLRNIGTKEFIYVRF